VPDEPDPTKDPLPGHFRESLYQYLDRLDLDRLAAKHLLRSLLVAGPGGDGRGAAAESRARWETAVHRLAPALDNSLRKLSGRGRLLGGDELDAAIADLDRHERTFDAEAVALSALADRSDLAATVSAAPSGISGRWSQHRDLLTPRRFILVKPHWT
jgi:hypothetical protein